ncbi:MAG: VWA domain-containing protein [Blastocatellia bacterium]|nr:VWA domain-containing protein [Blastocatellia bacterium]MCS7156473.1 VWA domain-containing protein [Blastocatellia bacterium]MCX7751786.1 VWA domain-containing protein [Blastocatellia bacterium]MDW8168888.1 VWA domain-containing protein [Acidobacteriota bacterium]MDW8256648.1 VWA domain-containing protein [Acidobacteriota bacterium]
MRPLHNNDRQMRDEKRHRGLRASHALVWALAAWLGMSVVVWPQQAPSAQGAQKKGEPQSRGEEVGEVVALTAELVILDVTVVDRRNHVVADLGKERFAVYENGVRQEIAFFSREETPVSLGLVLDTSGSMRRKLNKVVAAAKSLMRQSHSEDEYFLVEFKGQAELLEDFTQDVSLIHDALDNLIAGGQTALLDAVYLSVEHAQKYGKHRRKAILVVTDGEDRNSYYTREQVLERLRGSEVQVYVVGFTEGLGEATIFRQTESRRLSGQEKRARKLLEELARESGGRAFFPQSLDELDAIASAIARELRTQYAIGYYPSNPERDGSWRTVRVEVISDKERGPLTARTRAGYYAVRKAAAKPPSR